MFSFLRLLASSVLKMLGQSEGPLMSFNTNCFVPESQNGSGTQAGKSLNKFCTCDALNLCESGCCSAKFCNKLDEISTWLFVNLFFNDNSCLFQFAVQCLDVLWDSEMYSMFCCISHTFLQKFAANYTPKRLSLPPFARIQFLSMGKCLTFFFFCIFSNFLYVM